jgi:hypothetical protein
MFMEQFPSKMFKKDVLLNMRHFISAYDAASTRVVFYLEEHRKLHHPAEAPAVFFTLPWIFPRGSWWCWLQERGFWKTGGAQILRSETSAARMGPTP